MSLRKPCKVTNVIISPRHQIAGGGHRPETQVETWKGMQPGYPNPNLQSVGKKAISLSMCSSSMHLLPCCPCTHLEFTALLLLMTTQDTTNA